MQAVWHWCVHKYKVKVVAGVPHVNITGEALNIKRVDYNLTLAEEDDTEESEFHDMPISMWYAAEHVDDIFWAAFDKRVFTYDLDEEESLRRLDALTRDMALSMTSLLRRTEQDERGRVLGYARVGNMIVVIRWPWIALLATQVLLTIAFLIYVVIDTARTDVEIVKSSNTAEPLAFETRGQHPSFKDLFGGGMKAKIDGSLRGRLVKQGNAWHMDVGR